MIAMHLHAVLHNFLASDAIHITVCPRESLKTDHFKKFPEASQLCLPHVKPAKQHQELWVLPAHQQGGLLVLSAPLPDPQPKVSSAFRSLLLLSRLLCRKAHGLSCTADSPASCCRSRLWVSPPSRSSPHPLDPPLCPPAVQAALQAHDWQLEAAANALLNQQRGAAAGPGPGRSAPPVQQQSLGSPVLRGAGGSTPRSPANGKSPSGKGLARVSAAAASPVWQVHGQEFIGRVASWWHLLP